LPLAPPTRKMGGCADIRIAHAAHPIIVSILPLLICPIPMAVDSGGGFPRPSEGLYPYPSIDGNSPVISDCTHPYSSNDHRDNL
jgi:hypothetical protein